MNDNKIRLIIAGGRNFSDYDLLSQEAARFLDRHEEAKEIEIVSGGAKGADALGENFAMENGLKLTKFLAEWTKYGRAAGPQRNRKMAEYATHLLSFWDGKSKGTKSMISLAKKNGLSVKVVDIERNVVQG